MSRYFIVRKSRDDQNSRMQTQRFSPQNDSSKSSNFPRNSSEDNFVDFVPLDNSSPVHISGRGGRWKLHNNLASNSSFSPYSSNRNQKFANHNRSYSYNKSNRFSPQNNRGGQHNHRGSNTDLRSWFDPSMVEDPWAALEDKQEQCQQRTGVNNSTANINSSSPYCGNKNSNSSDSPGTCDMAGIKELSPSLSGKRVAVSTPEFIPL